MKHSYFFFLASLFIFSCAGSSDTNDSTSTNNETKVERAAESSSGISEIVMERGEQVYRKHCSACHQVNGEGLEALYPPLIGTKTVKGDIKYLVEISLNGLSGEIEVLGKTYNQVMIPHNFLSDREIADVLTYIRNSFGNEYTPVGKEVVASVRAAQSN